MSLRLRAAPVDLSDDGNTSGSESIDNTGEEETWSDWVSDSAQKCQSLFEPKTFPSVAEALAFDRDTHDFDLEAVCKRLSLDFLQRARLINYIRKQKLSSKDLQSLNGQEPFLSADEYLQPVLQDDPLLLATSDDWSESDNENTPSDLTSATRRIDLLEKKLQEAQRDLVDYKGLVSNKLDIGSLRDAINEPGPSGAGSSARDDDTHYFESYGANDIHAVMIQDRVRTSSYASFIMTNPSLFRDAVVMDVGCGTGILSLFAAKAGAKRVIAVDASDIAQKAKRIVKANGFEDVITVIQGKVEQITLPDGITEVDVIISEWMGYALLYESMLDSVLHARDRFLKPSGVMAPSECKMNLVLCEGSFDLSEMGEEVDEEAIVDVVGPDTVLSEPCTVKDLIIRDITTRQLDFTAPFTLVSTAERRTKIHSLVLYFDTFFSPTGDPVPEGTEVTLRKDGAGAVAEVWHVGGRPHVPRRPSQNIKEKDRITSFSTGPTSEPTHWKHTIFLLEEPIVVDEGTVVSGTFHCKKSEENSRELDVELHYAVRENRDAPVPEEVVVQMYKVPFRTFPVLIFIQSLALGWERSVRSVVDTSSPSVTDKCAGLYTALFAGSVYVLAFQRSKRQYLVTSIALWVLITGTIFLVLVQTVLTPTDTADSHWIDGALFACGSEPETPARVHEVVTKDLLIMAEDVLMSLSQIIADGLLVRSFAFTRSDDPLTTSHTYIDLSLFCYLGPPETHHLTLGDFCILGNSSVDVYCEYESYKIRRSTTPPAPPPPAWLHVVYLSDVASLACDVLGLANTVMTTVVTVGRIWWTSKQLARNHGRRMGGVYRTAMAILVESGAIYSTGLIIQLIIVQTASQYAGEISSFVALFTMLTGLQDHLTRAMGMSTTISVPSSDVTGLSGWKRYIRPLYGAFRRIYLRAGLTTAKAALSRDLQLFSGRLSPATLSSFLYTLLTPTETAKSYDIDGTVVACGSGPETLARVHEVLTKTLLILVEDILTSLSQCITDGLLVRSFALICTNSLLTSTPYADLSLFYYLGPREAHRNTLGNSFIFGNSVLFWWFVLRLRILQDTSFYDSTSAATASMVTCSACVGCSHHRQQRAGADNYSSDHCGDGRPDLVDVEAACKTTWKKYRRCILVGDCDTCGIGSNLLDWIDLTTYNAPDCLGIWEYHRFHDSLIEWDCADLDHCPCRHGPPLRDDTHVHNPKCALTIWKTNDIRRKISLILRIIDSSSPGLLLSETRHPMFYMVRSSTLKRLDADISPGLYMALFAGSVYVLAFERSKKHYLATSMVLFVAITIIIALRFAQTITVPSDLTNSYLIGGVSYTCSSIPDTPALVHGYMAIDLINVFIDMMNAISQIAADGLLIYRCFIIWHRKVRVVLLSVILLLATTACNLSHVYYDYQIYETLHSGPMKRSPGHSRILRMATVFDTANSLLALSTTVVTTALTGECYIHFVPLLSG
ncbi:hypothetical protein EVG20_g489 [Dentipellis fragilis]|uniref:type I protein arginine methyltransferase n=1 Tax=Dentipellis fragilis TaxID=205917 RepID=A0A4Y9ZEH4_9AGAM|nr:hypothetical protein EVG20_g489 [Dentipellis fragilis]